MSEPAYVEKATVVAELRSRHLHAKADWVERELPELIDTYKNAALLLMLGVDPGSMAPGEVAVSGS